jgi:hypothetical protein
LDVTRDFIKPLAALAVGLLTPQPQFILIVLFLLIIDFILYVWENVKGKRLVSQIFEVLETSFLRFAKHAVIYALVMVGAALFSKHDGFGWTEQAVSVAVSMALFTGIAGRASRILGDHDFLEVIKNAITKKS